MGPCISQKMNKDNLGVILFYYISRVGNQFSSNICVPGFKAINCRDGKEVTRSSNYEHNMFLSQLKYFVWLYKSVRVLYV